MINKDPAYRKHTGRIYILALDFAQIHDNFFLVNHVFQKFIGKRYSNKNGTKQQNGDDANDEEEDDDDENVDDEENHEEENVDDDQEEDQNLIPAPRGRNQNAKNVNAAATTKASSPKKNNVVNNFVL